MSDAIGITLGDVWGIGPEIIAKSLLKLKSSHAIKIFSDQESFERLAQEQHFLDAYSALLSSGLDLYWEDIGISAYCSRNDERQRAVIAQASMDKAIEQAMNNQLKGIVTAPLDKKVMRHAIPDFAGHTEYLKNKAQVANTWMMLDNAELKIILLNNHILIKEVSEAVSAEKIKQAIKDTVKHFKILDQDKVKIAVCALNPHCGELSETSEEKTIIAPAIKALQNEGFNVEGPFSADALFYQAKKSQKWTAILAMYHDQGLVAAKYPGTDQAVNITLGLPFVRVSPAHGVAYDIVGQNKANCQSMLKAIMTIQ